VPGARCRRQVFQATHDLHLSWPTVVGAFRTSAGEVLGALGHGGLLGQAEGRTVAFGYG
jgi:hypothetical protein